MRTSELDRRALGHDASHFLLTPAAIVAPRDAEEVARLLRATAAAGIGLTFRSGGTSLSGQAGTEGVLADVRRNFTGVEILDDGARVRVQPGVTVKQLNARLARYGRKFGPDPASEAACTIGGVVANNSSGMACGTVENSYRTLESVVVVLPSGTVIDTGATDADAKLRALEPALYEGLLRLRERVVANPASVAKITQQFSMKNTMGYGINALARLRHGARDPHPPDRRQRGHAGLRRLCHLPHIPLRNFVNTALVVFDDLYAANQALPALVATGAATLELMDATSLRVGQAFPDTPAVIRNLAVDRQAALLLEYQATTREELDAPHPRGRAHAGYPAGRRPCRALRGRGRARPAVEDPQGPVHLGGRRAAERHNGPARGRGRAGGEAGRHLRRPDRAVRQVRLRRTR